MTIFVGLSPLGTPGIASTNALVLTGVTLLGTISRQDASLYSEIYRTSKETAAAGS